MSLRQKTLLIIGITLVSLITLLYFISQTILLSNFAQLEEQEVRQNVERAAAALQDQLATLESTAGDWAAWDDTYAFVQDQNEQFIADNLLDSALINLNVNFMMFFNEDRHLVFGKAIDLQTETALNISPDLPAYLADNQTILTHTTLEDSLSGVIPLPEGPVLFASRPIITSNYEGPIQGTLIIGRYLNAVEIENLSKITNLAISVQRFDAGQLPPDFQAARAALAQAASIFVRPASRQEIAGYTLIEDIEEKPALLLKINLPRKIYQQGQASLFYFILSFLISGLLVMGVMVLLLEKEVLSRLTQLNRSVSTITATGNSTGRVKVTGQDELAALGQNINTMLATLEQYESSLGQTRQELEIRVEERTAELSTSNTQLKHEIQERQHAEEALRQSEQRFRQFVSSISDHIYVTEITPPGQRVNLYLSPNVESLTGYPLEKFSNDWNFWPEVVIHPEDRIMAEVQARRLARGEDSQLEYRLVRANGEIIWVRDSGRAEKELVSQNTFVYGVVSSITQRKQAEVALAQAHEAALKANLLKSQLLANVSHDLRTPLNAILGYVEMLNEGIYGPLSDKQRGVASKIINSTTHLTHLVNELLDQAHLEAGSLKLTATPFSPAGLIEHINATMSVLAETKGLQLTSAIAPDVPSPLIGDPLRLQQIVGNLVGNAIKFTRQGSVHLTIYRPDTAHWAIQVADTGPGIPPEAHIKLFDPFWQLDSTATRNYTGFGLGLSIVKQLVTLMQGQVSLVSQPGEGSTFTVCLPLTY